MVPGSVESVEWFSGMKWTQKRVMLGRDVGVFLENHPANSIYNMIYTGILFHFLLEMVYKFFIQVGIC